MKIGHSAGGFLEGDERVLTLQDRDIVDEETEYSLRIVDQDRASKYREMLSQNPIQPS